MIHARADVASGIAEQRAREMAIGFGFWLAFVLTLEPANLLGALRNGYALDLGREVLRMGGAAALGALVSPLLFALCRWCPWNCRAWPRTVAVYGVTLVAIGLGLLVVAHVLAAAFLPGGNDGSLGQQIVADLPLMVASMGGFVAVFHGWRQPSAPPGGREPRRRIAVPARTGLRWLDVADIDWIETQGNYICLHVGPAQHLLRETATGFEASVEGDRFVRIHRRAIVAVDRIASFRPLGSGDFELRLRDGTTLRGSRRHRRAVQGRASPRGRETTTSPK